MSDNQARGKATVHYDDAGRIIAVVLAPGGPNVPPAGILPMPGTKSAEIEIPRELAGVSALALHENCRVEAKGGVRLVPIRKDGAETKSGSKASVRRPKKRQQSA